MSKSNVDSDGFQIVTSKKGFKKAQTKIPDKDLISLKEEVEINLEEARKSIQSANKDLRICAYFQDICNAVSTNLQSNPIVEIVCFGLGHVGECRISRHQVALLLCLKDKFKARKVFVHDPLFYKSECLLLTSFDLTIIPENTEGRYAISNDCVTIAYFPHCPKQLTNNFIWSNWSAILKKCILICNSFTSLFDHQIERHLLETVPYIHKIYPHILEISLKNNYKHSDIFNDISVHIFPEKKIDLLNIEFWGKNERPHYDNDEEFITCHMIDKLKI